ncbi:MAG: zinc-ribbon domain-containing protein [Clostridia bacterium]|nr:zinc-ribbon domain-containing protein [Clostridia bacterium]
MYCSNCGQEINDNAAVCIHCGAAVNAGMANANPLGGAQMTYHDIPKCKHCGYIGQPEEEKLFRPMDWGIGLATIWFGFGLLYFIVIGIIRSDKKKRQKCPHCGTVGEMTDMY